MKLFTLTMAFDTDEQRAEFIGWFLDGGGEYQFGESCEAHGLPRMSPEPPASADHWEWGKPQVDAMTPSEPIDTPLPNYTIDMVVHAEADE